jgi:hypothetical protein
MTIEQFHQRIDELGDKIDSEYSTELGEQYIDTLQKFLQEHPNAFIAWADALAGRDNPVATSAVRLLRTGKVTSTTTFADLPAIIAADEIAA